MTTKTYMVIALMAITMSISMPMAFATSFDLSVNVGKSATSDRNLSISGDLTNINEAGFIEDDWIIQNVTITRDSLNVPKSLTASGVLVPILDLNDELVAYGMNLLFKDGEQIVKDFDLFFGTLTQVGDVTFSSDLADSSTYSIYGDKVKSNTVGDNGRTINIQNGTLSVEGLS